MLGIRANQGVYERWLRSQPRLIAALPLRTTNCGVCLGAP